MKHPFIKYILVPLLLLFFWTIATAYIVAKSDISLSVMSKIHDNSVFKQNSVNQLLKGKILNGEFVARENNLGIILLRFNTQGKSVEDRIAFRIKEKGSLSWYSTASYNTDQMVHDTLFPFGIPTISDSKNKTYYFEVESLMGTSEDSLSVSTVAPQLMTKYQFDKAQLKSSPSLLLHFFLQKTLGVLEDRSNLYLSLSFLIPLVLYGISLTFLRYFSHYKILSFKQPDLAAFNDTPVWTYFIILGLYIALVRERIYPVDLALAILWLIVILKFNLKHQLTLFLSCALYLISIFIPQTSIYYGNITLWANIYLLLGFLLFLFQFASHEK